MGETCTVSQAEAWLQEDLKQAYRAVELVTVPLSDNQYAALVLLAFNIGFSAFVASTLRASLNAGHYDAVPHELKRWNKGRVGDKLVVVKGLVNRRNAEIELWQAVG